MNARNVFLLAVLVVTAAPAVRAEETAEHWIAKARAYLGGEAALQGVRGIHYYGRLETTEEAESADATEKPAGASSQMPAEIVVQKPFQQLIILTKPGSVERKALDGYEGWAKSTNVQSPKQWRFRLLEAREIKQLRANTWENLNFFAGLEEKGGQVRLDGEVTVDGVACVKLSFIHADDIVFIRYFDRASGRLLKTETESGGEIREEGELIVDGIRFPRKVVNKGLNGQITSLTIERVVLNDLLPASEFAVPTLLVD